MDHILQIIPSFRDISCVHVFREQNRGVDVASKCGLHLRFGKMFYEMLLYGSIFTEGSFNLLFIGFFMFFFSFASFIWMHYFGLR